MARIAKPFGMLQETNTVSKDRIANSIMMRLTMVWVSEAAGEQETACCKAPCCNGGPRAVSMTFAFFLRKCMSNILSREFEDDSESVRSTFR